MALQGRILIVGHSGQVARALVQASWPSTLEVRAEGRPSLDLCNQERIASVVGDGGWSAVVNAAAYTKVDQAEAEFDMAFAVNRDGVEALAVACSQAAIPLLHVSTDYVFDGAKLGAYAEDDPINPLSVYGASKAEGEMAVRTRLENHVILRTSWVFSASGHNFVRTMLRLAGERSELRIVDDQHGCPTAAQDIAAAIVQIVVDLLKGKTNGFGTFHFANAGATTWFGVARELFSEAGRRGYAPIPRLTGMATSDYPTSARRPMNSVLDTRRITEVYNILPRNWKDALSETLDTLVGPAPQACDRSEAVR